MFSFPHSGKYRDPAGTAHRGGGVHVSKSDAGPDQPVQIRCLKRAALIDAEGVYLLVVREKEYDVRLA